MKRKGYTLIEILVAVGIIVVVAGILFPIFSSVRESGRLTECISNLHQFGAAIEMYRQDWGGLDPAPGRRIGSLYDLGLPPTTATYAFFRMYHLDKPEVYYCPSARPAGNRPKLPYTRFFLAQDDPLPGNLEAFYRRGSEVPLAACLYHNPNPNLEDNPTWGTVRVVAVRFNQRVDVHNIRAWGVSSWDW
jgi:prepilin-type N-terminal cleavage/methylation domain-containing protein